MSSGIIDTASTTANLAPRARRSRILETVSSQMIDAQLSQLLFHYVIPDEELSPENRLYRDNAIAQYWYARVLPHRDRTNES
jgi:hypothetical protein